MDREAGSAFLVTRRSRIGLWTVPQKAHDNNGPIINAIGY